MSILWTIIIGFIVGVIAKFIMPGDKTEPRGFILTSILGIVGAFVATYLGRLSGGTSPEKPRASSVAWSAPSSCFLSMASSWVARGALSDAIPIHAAPVPEAAGLRPKSSGHSSKSANV